MRKIVFASDADAKKKGQWLHSVIRDERKRRIFNLRV
jgi:hypothetical protein